MDFFHEEFENIFFEILLPKTKPMTVGIIYRPPNQNNLLQTLNENFAKLDTLKKNYTFLVTSIYTCIKIKIIQDSKAILLCQRQFLMVSKIVFNFPQSLAFYISN